MKARRLVSIAAAGLVLVVAGCGIHEDLEIQPADEIPTGPGLFSGDDGQFVVVQEDVWSNSCRRGCGPAGEERPEKESEPE